MKKKLVLFDFDGVLVDTLGINFSINVEVQSNLSLEEYKAFFEGDIFDVINSGKKADIPDFDEQYKARTRELEIPSELKLILKDLSKNYDFAVVSSTSSSAIKDILTREGLGQYFSDVLGYDVHKSKVTKIKTILAKYNISPENSVFITDTAGDVKDAKECGVKSVAVTWGFHSLETLQKVNPSKIVDIPADLATAIEKILC